RRELEKIGFGTFPRLTVFQIDFKLVSMLIKNYDKKSRSINVGGVSIPLSPEVVESYFGLSRHGMIFPKNVDVGKKKHTSLFADEKGNLMGYYELKEYVSNCKTTEPEFVVPYLMLLFATVLFPRTKDNEIFDDPITTISFTTDDDAEKWYINYATNAGFDVRRCSRKTTKTGFVKNRQWECSCAGFRRKKSNGIQLIRKEKPNIRCGCKAGLRIAHDISGGVYWITHLNTTHNHSLATSETAHRLKCN
ncbi:Unknown protein, partial [Striga hermonthica]